MPEETIIEVATPMQEGAENQPAGDSQLFTQEQVNQLVGNARKKERAKYANYDQYKADSEQLAEIKAANQTDLEKALSRAEKAEAELHFIHTQKAIAELRDEVAKETGIPAEILSGSTREEIEACAERLEKYIPKSDSRSPYVASDGFAPSKEQSKSTREQFAHALRGF